MRFEVGKYYRHNCGKEMKIIAKAEDPVYWMGPTWIAVELGTARLVPVGNDSDNHVGWREVPPWVESADHMVSAVGDGS